MAEGDEVITDERLAELISFWTEFDNSPLTEQREVHSALRELQQLRSEKHRLKSDLEDSCRRVHALERQATESANAFHCELTALRQPPGLP